VDIVQEEHIPRIQVNFSISARRAELEFYHAKDKALKTWVEIGTKGHFPLFLPEWMQEIEGHHKKLTGNEKVKAKTLFKKICQHRTLEKQKTLLMAMNTEERCLFIKAFLKMVENKILDGSPEIQ
jgi:hypothetical protein